MHMTLHRAGKRNLKLWFYRWGFSLWFFRWVFSAGHDTRPSVVGMSGL